MQERLHLSDNFVRINQFHGPGQNSATHESVDFGVYFKMPLLFFLNYEYGSLKGRLWYNRIKMRVFYSDFFSEEVKTNLSETIFFTLEFLKALILQMEIYNYKRLVLFVGMSQRHSWLISIEVHPLVTSMIFKTMFALCVSDHPEGC